MRTAAGEAGSQERPKGQRGGEAANQDSDKEGRRKSGMAIGKHEVIDGDMGRRKEKGRQARGMDKQRRGQKHMQV